MKTLHLSEYFYPFTLGGSEWSVYYLLQNLRHQGQEVYLLTPNYGTDTQENYEGIPVFRYPFFKQMSRSKPRPIAPFWHNNPFTWLVTFFYLGRFLQQHQIDVIHVHSKSQIPAGVVAQWLFGVPAVITLRDYFPLCAYGLCLTENRHFSRCNLSYLLNWELPAYLQLYTQGSASKIFHLTAALYSRLISSVYRFFLKKAYAVVCLSRKMRQIYAANGMENLSVIYNSMQFAAALQKQKVSSVILFVGRLTPGKGANIFLEAGKSLLGRYPQIRLAFIGAGVLHQQLVTNLTFSQKKRIHLLGQLDYQATLARLQTALVAVVPSVWEEPFGRVALEALSLGVPVVATDRGGLPEIVVSGETGYVVKADNKSLADGIEKAIVNNHKLRLNIKSAYDKLKRTFSDQPGRNYLQLYRKCKA